MKTKDQLMLEKLYKGIYTEAFKYEDRDANGNNRVESAPKDPYKVKPTAGMKPARTEESGFGKTPEEEAEHIAIHGEKPEQEEEDEQSTDETSALNELVADIKKPDEEAGLSDKAANEIKNLIRRKGSN
jgi:hypothetical protein